MSTSACVCAALLTVVLTAVLLPVQSGTSTFIPTTVKTDSECNYNGELVLVNNARVCKCLAGFNGTLCETDIDECGSSPCQHGDCFDGPNAYFCKCVPGYNGVNCEIDIDECASGPCKNTGTCEDKVNEYTCSCVNGTSGENCQINFNECASSPCLHGRCLDRINFYSCRCRRGYVGVNCETNVDECASQPCHHGNCTDNVNSYSCICDGSYTGVNCETPTFTTESTIEEGTPTSPAETLERVNTKDESLGIGTEWAVGAASGVAAVGVVAAAVKGIQLLKSRFRLPSSRSKISGSQPNADNGNRGGNDNDDRISVGSMSRDKTEGKVFLLGRYTDFVTVQITPVDIRYIKEHTESLKGIQPMLTMQCTIVEILK